MKHSVKLLGSETKTRFCRIGSGVKDKNGCEIFEGDILKDTDGNGWLVIYRRGQMEIYNGEIVEEFTYTSECYEVVGTASELGICKWHELQDLRDELVDVVKSVDQRRFDLEKAIINDCLEAKS